MLRSMTGFGTGKATDGQRELVLEVRATNHKFCEVRTRLPRELSALEGQIQERIRRQISRGRVDVSIEAAYLPGAIAEPHLNLALARGYHAAITRIAGVLGLPPEISLEFVAGAPGVLEAPEAGLDLGRTAALVGTALNDALASLGAMRLHEGASLAEDLGKHLEEVDEHLAAVKDEIPRANALRLARLEHRLAELLTDRTVDENRLAQEVAILVDRADISEEVARLESHAAQFRLFLEADDPVGRKLDFLLQEMNREANTIGAKSASSRASHLVVELKAAIERIREQVQNVE